MNWLKKKKVKIELVTWHRSVVNQIGMLRRGDRIHIQGWIPSGIGQKEGIIVIKVCTALDWPFYGLDSSLMSQ